MTSNYGPTTYTDGTPIPQVVSPDSWKVLSTGAWRWADPNDPANNCLDVAIITAPEKRTQKTRDKLKTIAGRVLNK